MLNEIIIKLGMRNTVFNLRIHLKKSLDPVQVPTRFDMATNIIQIPLIVYDHLESQMLL
jgi:hypothetical protein